MTDPTHASDMDYLRGLCKTEQDISVFERVAGRFAQQDAAIVRLSKAVSLDTLFWAQECDRLEKLLEIEQQRSGALEKKIEDMKTQTFRYFAFVEKW